MKYLKIKFIPVFILCICALSEFLHAQDIAGALRDYDQGRLNEVREALIALRPSSYNKPEYLFLIAVFEEDGEAAFAQYGEIEVSARDNPVFERVLLRMCQYYYAKGLYKACSDALGRFIETFPGSDNKEIALLMRNRIALHLGVETPDTLRQVEEPTALYTIQLGVFGNESNARTRLLYLRNLGIAQSYIMEQQIGDQTFYKVWAGEFKSKDEAMKMLEELKNKYKITDILVVEKK